MNWRSPSSLQKRATIALILVLYTAGGVLWLGVFSKSAPESQADETQIAALNDSLRADSMRWQQRRMQAKHDRQAEREARRQHKIDSINRLKAIEAAERALRDSIREHKWDSIRTHRRDSTQHYWDSVHTAQAEARAQRDSTRAVRDSLRLYININTASAQRLRNHPYISGEQAEAIVQSRRKYHRIEGWHQLMRLSVFTAADSVRLVPFVVF